MALLATFRKLKTFRTHSILCLSQIYNAKQSSPMRSVSKAFHQTASGLNKRTSLLDRIQEDHIQKSYQTMKFDDHADINFLSTESGFHEVLEKIQKAKDFASGDEAIAFLNNSGIKPDKDFIFSMIWALREEWKLAFLVFKWGEKWDCVVEKTWCLVIWLLGNHKKFSTAWTLINELRRDSRDTHQAMMIMIDRYAAANLVDKAIETFDMMQMFNFSPDQKTYFKFLNILCKHGYIENAEEFMFLNNKFFPLETESFNIILNGWCKVATDIFEAKRVWREMSKCCIEPNEISYSHMILCYSRVGNLFDSLRLYDGMKKRNWVPGVEVYHSLIYVLTRENCINEALKFLERMKEVGLKPNSSTYNFIIHPLCEAEKFDEAREILTRMLGDNVVPDIDTFHALLQGEGLEVTLGVLNHMRKVGLEPNRDTFLLILAKFFKLDEPENSLRIWSEMRTYMVKPDNKHYCALVEGLAKCGLIIKAREYYSEMVSAGLGEDPSLKKLLEDPCQKAKKREWKMTVVRKVQRVKVLRGETSSNDRTIRRRKQRERKKASES